MLNFSKDIVDNLDDNKIKFDFFEDETSKSIAKLRN